MHDLAGTFLRLLTRTERLIAVALFAFMAIVMMADVAMREITGVGIDGAPRVAVYCFIVVAMISFGLASDTAAHLRPRFADTLFPAHWDPMLKRVQEIIMTVFCLIFAMVATGVVRETYALQEMARTLRVPVWPMQTVIPLAFYLAAIRHGLYACFLDLKPLPASQLIGEE